MPKLEPSRVRKKPATGFSVDAFAPIASSIDKTPETQEKFETLETCEINEKFETPDTIEILDTPNSSLSTTSATSATSTPSKSKKTKQIKREAEDTEMLHVRLTSQIHEVIGELVWLTRASSKADLITEAVAFYAKKVANSSQSAVLKAFIESHKAQLKRT